MIKSAHRLLNVLYPFPAPGARCFYAGYGVRGKPNRIFPVPRPSSLVLRPASFVPRPSSRVLRLSSLFSQEEGSNGGGTSGSPFGREEGPASLFAGIRRSSRWSLLEDSGEPSFSNRNVAFRFEAEEQRSDTEFSRLLRKPCKRSERSLLRRDSPARLCLLSPRCERKSLPQERKIPRLILAPAAAKTSPPLRGPPPLKGRQNKAPI